ncbi:MAG: FHA domain-containing protein [Acidobacteriota bacterium]|nr:MAG: FHA domain-containing protein [Acidobacteriota bacterium]
METIVLRFLSGLKAQRIEKYPLKDLQELVIGADPAATVNIADEGETGADRFHARIIRDASNPSQFILSDLKSRNGTYVNGERIAAPTILKRGDVIQCGANGPHLQFYLEPGTEPLIPDLPAQAAGDPFIKARYPSGERQQTTEDPALEPMAATVIGDLDETIERETEAPAGVASGRNRVVRPFVIIALLFAFSSIIVAGMMYYRGREAKGQTGATPQPSPGATVTAEDRNQPPSSDPASVVDDNQGSSYAGDKVEIPTPTVANRVTAPPVRIRPRETQTRTDVKLDEKALKKLEKQRKKEEEKRLKEEKKARKKEKKKKDSDKNGQF